MNVCEHLTATARIFPERTAIRFEGTGITYAQLNHLSQVAAQEIRQLGLQPGDRIALMLANVPAFAVWYYAALRCGAIVVSVSTRSASSEVEYYLNDCEAKLFVCGDTEFQRDGLHIIKTNDHGQQFEHIYAKQNALPVATARLANTFSQADTVELSQVHDAKPNDPATILYTSGTTGFAKGATLSHLNVRSNVCAFNHLCQQTSKERILLAVPLFHCFGQNALLNSAFNVGATLILQRKFDLNETKRLIAAERVTQLYGVPMMFQLLLDSCEPKDLASVDYCFSAAATLPIQTGKLWQQKFGQPIYEGYGLTETSPFASYNHRNRFVSGSIGTPIDNVEMKIVDTETGQECPPGELGEIIIRGPNVMLGYWNRDTETRAAIQDGWFYSGDIGRQDNDGFFYIVDRVKDMIAVGGLKVFPAEVERVLRDHSSVHQCAVVGLPDDVFGEQVVAFVVLAEPETLDSRQVPDIVASLSAYAKENLANFKVPRVIVPVDELPRNASGKILKRELRKHKIQSHHLVVSVPQQQDSFQETYETVLKSKLAKTHAAQRVSVATQFVQDIVQSIADLEDQPSGQTRFLDAGLDSLMIVEISHVLQAEVGQDTEIPPTLVFDHPRLCDLAEYLVNTLYVPESSQTPSLPTTHHDQVSPSDLRTQVESMSEAEALAELMKELESQ